MTQRKIAATAAVTMLLAVLQYLMFAVTPIPAGAQTGGPAECTSDLWNGVYWKVQINDRVADTSAVEANVSDFAIRLDLDVTGDPWEVDWTNQHYKDVFRIVLVAEQSATSNIEGRWSDGEGSTFTVPDDISHLTFCFSSPSSATTTTEAKTTTTTTEETTTTTTEGSTTTTQGVAPTTTTQGATTTVAADVGVIVIEKDAPDAEAEEFPFDFQGASFTLQHGESQSFTNLAAGQYTISEGMLAGWGVEAITCDDGSFADLAQASVTIDVAAGDAVHCVFSNLPVDVLGVQIESTTTTAAAATTAAPATTIAPVTTDTLPFTGFVTEEMLVLGLVAMTTGGLLLFTASRREEDGVAGETIGRWNID